jgi:spore germination protein
MRSVVRHCAFVVLAIAALPALAGYRMSAWVPSWDSNAVPIVAQNGDALDEANPGWYTVAADGSITKNWGAEDPKLRAALSGIELFPTIKNYYDGFDGQLVANVVSTAASREKHAENVAALVVVNAYDGIDIDYESVPSSARANFTAFIELLAAKLHSEGKKLSVTVHAKTSDSTRNGPGAQDWASIGAAADSVKIMAYDKHWSTSDAGAISPLDWLDQVATYAEKTIPSHKIIIGLPWYGYDWMGTRGESVTYSEAMSRAQSAKAAVTHESTGGEAFFTYNGRSVFFQDAEAYRRKVEWLTERHAIGGFAAWRVGAEDPAIWHIVRALHTSGSTGSTPVEQVKKEFAISGPADVRMIAGATQTATFSYLSINGFEEQVSVSAQSLDAFSGTATFSAPRITRTTSTTLSIAAAAPGTYRFLITMTGATMSREQMLTVRVDPAPDFALESLDTVTLKAGKSVTLPLSMTPRNGFAGNATVSAQMLDAFPGTITVSAPTVAANGTVLITVATPPRTAKNTYRLEVTATSGTITRTQIVHVTVAQTAKRRSSGVR